MESIQDKLNRGISDLEGRIALAESKIQRKLEAGEITPEQAEHSLNTSVAKLHARLRFQIRERDQWLQRN